MRSIPRFSELSWMLLRSRKFDAAGHETTIDFARMMELVKDSKYRGCITIEHLGDEPMAGIRKSVALVKHAI